MTYYSDSTARRNRVINGSQRILYHQTNQDCADKILSTGIMKRGSNGMAGGGIYFAETSDHTDHKAHRRGVILKVTVALGNTKTIDKDGDYNITFTSLIKQGYDSVKIPRDNGIEFVVYNWDQILFIQCTKTNKSVNGKYKITTSSISMSIEYSSNYYSSVRKCKCGMKLVKRIAINCYGGSAVSCDLCGDHVFLGDMVWNCSTNSSHPRGYDICTRCSP